MATFQSPKSLLRTLRILLGGRHSWRETVVRAARRGDRKSPPDRNSPTGPGPAKSCEKRSGGFPTPTPSGGLKVPPPIRPTPVPPGPSESNGGEEGDKNVPPPGAPCFSQELPYRPRSGEILREKEWGFSYPHSHGGTESPPSYSRNSGRAGAQRRQPRRRGGQECPPSGGASFLRSSPTGPGPAKSCEKRSGGFPTPTPSGETESPPSYPPNSGPTGAQRKQPRRRGGQECPPSGRGFSYPRLALMGR